MTDGEQHEIEELRARLDAAGRALRTVEHFLQSPHTRLGEACGSDACILCLVESTASDALARLHGEVPA